MNTPIEARPVTGELGSMQKFFADGPVTGPEMTTYICKGCNNKFPDTGLYFYGVSSTKCIWCTKFPKAKTK